AAVAAGTTPLLFTFQDEYVCPAGHRDISGAQQLAKIVDLEHSVLVAKPTDNSPFEAMLAPRFSSWASTIERSETLRQKLILKGWCSETVRAFIRWPGCENVSALQIADCIGVGKIPATHRHAQEWHSEAMPVAANCNIHILDLFYWELKSRWIGSGLN